MALPVAPANENADRVQLALVRSACIARRVERARSLSTTVVTLARRALRDRHPDWSEREVMLHFVELHYGDELADRLRDHLALRVSDEHT